MDEVVSSSKKEERRNGSAEADDVRVVLDSNVFQEVTCAICTNYFVRPVTLPCGHSFCRLCISRLVLVNLRSTIRAAEDASAAQCTAPAGTCPHCRSPVPPSAPILGVNVGMRSFVRVIRRASGDNASLSSGDNEDREYRSICEELRTLYGRKGWDSKSWKRKLHLIMAGSACVPNMAEAVDILSGSDDDSVGNSTDESHAVCKLMRESFGDRLMTRTLVVDPDDSQMRLALSFTTFPRRIYLDKIFAASVAVLRLEEDECTLVPPMVTEDDRRLLARDFVETKITCEARWKESNTTMSDSICLDDAVQDRPGSGSTLFEQDAEMSDGVALFGGLKISSADDENGEEATSRFAIVRFSVEDFNLHCIMTFKVEAANGDDDTSSADGADNCFGGVRMEMGVVVDDNEYEEDSFIASEDDSFIVSDNEEKEEEEEETVGGESDADVSRESIPRLRARGSSGRRIVIISSDSEDEDENESDEGNKRAGSSRSDKRSLQADAALARIEAKRKKMRPSQKHEEK